MARFLIAGCGDIGIGLGLALHRDGHQVWGLRRNTAALPTALQPFAAELGRELPPLPPALDGVFFTAAADRYDEVAYRTVYDHGMASLITALERDRQTPRRIVMISSTSVYGQNNGDWVDENSPASATGFGAASLLAGEHHLAQSDYEGVVLRLGGIYGPHRTRLLNTVRRGEARCTAGIYSNRIHRDDAIGALMHLWHLPHPETLYLGVDDAPSSLCEVMHWLAEQLDAPAPQPGGSDRQRLRSNKRCRNQRLRDSGWNPRYPNYRVGYADLIATTVMDSR